MSSGGAQERIVITGGAGFVGSSLAIGLKERRPGLEVIAFDNLKRRGSELGLPRLRAGGVRFMHGDVRSREDLAELPRFDTLIDCAAEPSVLAGLGASASYVVDTNLQGTLNVLDVVRRHGAGIVFLSTSRVYPIGPLEQLPFEERATRFAYAPLAAGVGHSEHGIAENFTLEGARSIYGATKLCSELMIQEYASAFDVPAVIDRCGVLTGPWQMGKVDQGVVMHWVLSHLFERPLSYIGYGGTGKQVRDILSVDDLLELVDTQLRALATLRGEVFNVGGGAGCSVSLAELTELCRAATGRVVPVGAVTETRTADLRMYVSDTRKARERFGFTPRATPSDIVEAIARWVRDHRDALAQALSGP